MIAVEWNPTSTLVEEAEVVPKDEAKEPIIARMMRSKNKLISIFVVVAAFT
jgi:hypothetical protein